MNKTAKLLMITVLSAATEDSTADSVGSCLHT